MYRNSAVTTAVAIAYFSLAGAVGAATCNVIAQDKEINFTLTKGNPNKVVDQACVGDENDAQTIAEAIGLNTRGFDAVRNTRTRTGGQSAKPRMRVTMTAFGGGGGGARPASASVGGAPTGTVSDQLSEFWSTSGQVYRSCENPDFTPAGILSKEDENACLYEDVVDLSVLISEDEGEQPPAVPLPAAGGLLLAALGGLTMLRRRGKF